MIDEIKLSRRQQKIVADAERTVALAKAAVEAAEHQLQRARASLKDAERSLHRVYEAGDCL